MFLVSGAAAAGMLSPVATSRQNRDNIVAVHAMPRHGRQRRRREIPGWLPQPSDLGCTTRQGSAWNGDPSWSPAQGRHCSSWVCQMSGCPKATSSASAKTPRRDRLAACPPRVGHHNQRSMYPIWQLHFGCCGMVAGSHNFHSTHATHTTSLVIPR